jgi:hypothetical protein
MTAQYTSGKNGTGIREHISEMNQLNNKLMPMNLALEEDFLVHVVFASLPKEFDNFVVSYNIQHEKWNLERCLAMCVQGEDRIRAAGGGSLNFVRDNKKKNANANVNSPSKSKGKGRAPMQHQPKQNKMVVNKDQCLHCHKEGHYKKDFPEYLKYVIKCRGENIITFVNESLYI